jgi:hypothetical protein
LTKHNIYIGLKYWTKNVHLKKRRAGGKKEVFSGGEYQGEVGGHKERGNEDEYGGYVLYPYIKIEE